MSEDGTPDALPAEPAPLRLASFNIHRAIGRDGRRDPARIAAVIGELRADVIGLQEVDWRHDHTDRLSQFEYLKQLPGFQAVAGPNLRDHRGHYGNLLLTRCPPHEVRSLDLTNADRESRGAIDVDLGIAGAVVRVIVTHLGLGLGERWRQARRLRDEIAARPGRATVILGDLNDWLPGSPSLRPLLRLMDATARPASYPSWCPVLALDRILTCGLAMPPRIRRHASRLARQASDHLPVVADIDSAALSPPPPTAAPRQPGCRTAQPANFMGRIGRTVLA